MNNILFISTVDIHKKDGGGLATLAYYNAFRLLYGDCVKLAIPSEACHDQFSMAIPIFPRNRFCAYKGILKGCFHRYRDFLVEHLKSYHNCYSIVIINGGFYAGDMIGLCHSYGIRVIVIHHNYEPEYHMDNRTLATIGGITPYFVARNERNAYLKADLNVFLTSSDMALHKKHYGNSRSKFFLLGVFEPQPYHSLLGLGDNRSIKTNSFYRIMISGSMNTVQTIRGIMDFQRHYYPLIHSIFSEYEVVITGRDPNSRILNFEQVNRDHVKVIPNPLNINEIIASGSIFLCPTNVGGGLKLRLMDGFRNGLPVLTHKVSARGYENFMGEPFFRIYEDKDSFQNGLLDLARYVSRVKEYKQDICAKYKEVFSFEAGCSRIAEMMKIFSM